MLVTEVIKFSLDLFKIEMRALTHAGMRKL